MENKTVHVPHFISLLCVFTVADGVIFMPASDRSLTNFIIACLFGTLAAFFGFMLPGRIFEIKRKTVRGIVYSAAALAALTAAVFSAREYTGFIYENLLIRENMFSVKVIFALCAAFLAAGERKAIYKFSLLSAVFVSVIFTVMFLVSVKNFDFGNIKPAFDFKDTSAKAMFSCCLKLIFPLSFAVLFISEDRSKRLSGLSVSAGVFTGAVLSGVIILDSVLSFGLPLAAKLKYPYIDDISTVTLGSLFTRMDGFAHFAFFVCYVLKCAVLLRLSAGLFGKLGIKKEKSAALVISLALLI